MRKEVLAGIDIGGTKIALALQTPAGEKIAADRLPTAVELGPDRIVEKIAAALEKMLTETDSRLTAIGVGCPGPIDIERGLVLSPANLPDWYEFPLVEKLDKRFGVAVVLDNDANAAALGEYFYGAGSGFVNVFYVTISTGIGGAIICEGNIHHGVGASAGEIGHTIVKSEGALCRCGNRGCLETIASGSGIARRMRETLAAQNGKSLEKYDSITSATVVEGVRSGDATALRIWDETIHYLGLGIGNAITLIAPDAVVIGGGVAAAGAILLEPLRREIRKNVTMLPIEKVAIRQASLGSESGVCGALILAARAGQKKYENV